MLVLRTSEPDVPVTVTVKVPVVAVPEADRVSVELALPPAGGVTEDGANDAVTPLGRPEALSETAELNPLRLLTVMVLVPEPPWVTLTEDGEADMPKSGTGAPVTVRPTLKDRVSAPLVPWAWKV
jgi:hypothetical protein